MKKTLMNQLTILALILPSMILFAQVDGLGKDSISNEIILTTNPASRDHQEEFSAYETVYSLITLSDLEPGQYTAEVRWTAPSGTISKYSSFSFTLGNQPTYTFSSWLHLMKNSPLKRTFGGEVFNARDLGKWELHVSINDTMLEKKTFILVGNSVQAIKQAKQQQTGMKNVHETTKGGVSVTI